MGTEGPDAGARRRVGERLVGWARARPAFSMVVVVGLAGIVYLSYGVLWPGDRIRIKSGLGDLLGALQEGDVEAAMSHVSPYFHSEGIDHRMLGRLLRRALGRRELLSATLSVRQIEMTAGWAHVQVYVRSSHQAPYGRGFTGSDWFLRLEKIGDRWYVREAHPVSVEGHSAVGLREILAGSP